MLYLIASVCFDKEINRWIYRQTCICFCLYICMHTHQPLECSFCEKFLNLPGTEKVQQHKSKAWKHEINRNSTNCVGYSITLVLKAHQDGRHGSSLSVMEDQYPYNMSAVISNCKVNLGISWDPFLYSKKHSKSSRRILWYWGFRMCY